MGKKVGTWIYYDKKGNQLSKIQHNQVVRQNNGFTLFVAFDADLDWENTEIFDGQKTKEIGLKAFIRKPSESEYSNITYADSHQGNLVKFEKISENEMTYGLVDGKQYIVYELKFETINKPTNEYGNINIDIRTHNFVVKDDYNHEDEPNYKSKSLGTIDLYVQPTYNNDDEDIGDITRLNNRIDERVKINDGESFNQKLLTQGVGVITIDGKVDTTKAKFSALTQEENEDLRPSTVGYVNTSKQEAKEYTDEQINILSDEVNANLNDKVETLDTKIDTEVETLDTKINTEVKNINDNLNENYSTTDEVMGFISQAGHVVDIDVATEWDLENNGTPSVGIKYKTIKDTTNYTEVVTIPLPKNLVTEEELHKEYKVKTLENGNSSDVSEAGYAKFHYNQKEIIKAKMPTNILYFTESEEGDGEPVESEFVEKAKLDSLGQTIVSTYTKDLKIGLSNDVLTIESITGEDRAKGNAVNVSLTEYAKKTNIPTKLKQLVSDEENRTVTDLEKEEWNKKEIQLLNSLFIENDVDTLPLPNASMLGATMLAKTNGLLPLVVYKVVKQEQEYVWKKVDNVKTNCLYILKNTGLVYTFLETEPYFKQVSSEANVDLSNYATKIELQNYSLKTQTGNNIELALNNGNLTLVLKNDSGQQIDSSTVSLPKDQIITSGEYVDGKIILSLQDGTTIEIPVEEMVSGLATTTQVETLSTNLNKEINSLKSGKANDADLKSVAKLGTFASLNEKPTTISGYGITDAYIDGDVVNEQVVRLGDKTITPITNITYDMVGSKPKLNTSNTTSLNVNEEEIIGNEIKLHKVSKTGSSTDLVDYDNLVKVEQLNEVKNSKINKPSNTNLAQAGQALLFQGTNSSPTWGDVIISGTMSLIKEGISVSNSGTVILDDISSGDIYEIYGEIDSQSLFTRLQGGTGSAISLYANSESDTGITICGIRFESKYSSGKQSIIAYAFRNPDTGGKYSGYINKIYKVTIR